MYFIDENGEKFSVFYIFRPYFYIYVSENVIREVESLLLRKYEGIIVEIETVEKEDLELLNHLSGLKRTYLKLVFYSVQGLMKVKKDLFQKIQTNKSRKKQMEHYELDQLNTVNNSLDQIQDSLNFIFDIREYDVPYVSRVCIDNGFYGGTWYDVMFTNGRTVIQHNQSRIELPPVRVFAYDIETTKPPLKFPNSNNDSIMMISYMVDGDGFLLVNREIVAVDDQLKTGAIRESKSPYNLPLTVAVQNGKFRVCLICEH
jgi:DNA polymerase epsilon subunit 1